MLPLARIQHVKKTLKIIIYIDNVKDYGARAVKK